MHSTLDIPSLIQRCHKASRDGGWYTDLETGLPLDRNVGEMMVLIHSEVSEAYDAWRSDSMDDKLPHRLGVEVELADTLIRIFDLAGYLKLQITQSGSNIVKESITSLPKAFINEIFNNIHYFISEAYEGYRKLNLDKLSENLSAVTGLINLLGIFLKIDISGAIEEKLEYNANRADHKIENRKKPGGKRT